MEPPESKTPQEAELRRQIKALEGEIVLAREKLVRVDTSIMQRNLRLNRLKAQLALCESGHALPAMACG